MIDFKLAKKLREAGFYQEGLGIYILTDNNGIEMYYSNESPLIKTIRQVAMDNVIHYVPTLFELVDSCLKIGDGISMSCSKTGHCIARSFKNNKNFTIKGKDLEKTVALLWLELNKVTKNKA
jgi:hypothetical protein